MKTTTIILMTFFSISCVFGQDMESNVSVQLDAIRKKVEILSRENQAVRNEIRERDSAEYCQMRREILMVYTHISRLEFNFEKTVDNIALTGLFTKLMKANNPSSDILGFRFTEVIFSACEKHFLKEINDEKDKKRLGQIITKIIGSPVVSALASTNPFTSVVSAIINTIIGFSTTIIETRREGNRIKAIEAENREPVSQESITAFKEELEIYIRFYDALIIASNKYLFGLNQLNAKYASLMMTVRSYKETLYELAEADGSNTIIRLSTMLPDPEAAPLAFNHFITDERLVEMLDEARKYPMVSQSVNDFKLAYNRLLMDFLTNYKETLQLSYKFPKGALDLQRTEELIDDINKFMEGLSGDFLPITDTPAAN